MLWKKHIEEAYYRKHYIIPPEGAEVFIKGGGHLESFTVIQRHNIFWGKARTPKGEYLLGLDLNEATLESREWRRERPEQGIEDRLAKILALVYRDMVISIGVLSSRKPHLLEAVGVVEDKEPKKYEWVYIPRVRRIPIFSTRIDEIGDTTRKSPRPHRVSGFKRKGNITAKHELEVRKFEQETGIQVLNNLPEGYTFVKPHISPKGSLESQLAKLPKFIKRRIEEDLRGSIRVQL